MSTTSIERGFILEGPRGYLKRGFLPRWQWGSNISKAYLFASRIHAQNFKTFQGYGSEVLVKTLKTTSFTPSSSRTAASVATVTSSAYVLKGSSGYVRLMSARHNASEQWGCEAPLHLAYRFSDKAWAMRQHSLLSYSADIKPVAVDVTITEVES